MTSVTGNKTIDSVSILNVKECNIPINILVYIDNGSTDFYRLKNITSLADFELFVKNSVADIRLDLSLSNRAKDKIYVNGSFGISLSRGIDLKSDNNYIINPVNGRHYVEFSNVDKINYELLYTHAKKTETHCCNMDEFLTDI